MPLADLYAYLLERKLVTVVFYRPREGPQCLDSIHPRNVNTILGLKGIPIDNKLIQLDNVTTPNIIINPLPPHQEGNVNAIITVEERVTEFSSPSFPWKAMLQALVQESHLDLKVMGTPEFDCGIYSFYDNEDSYALFDCTMLRAQLQSLADHGII